MIYIAVESGGEYPDEYWDANRAAFVQRSDAEEFIARTIEKENKISEGQSMLANFYEEYISSHPVPYYEPLYTIPRWAAGLGEAVISAEMRQERAALIAQNNEISDRNTKTRADYRERILHAQRAFADANGIAPPEFVVMSHYREKTPFPGSIVR